MLLLWFLVIIALTVPDLVNDYVTLREPVQTAVNKLSELVELLIAVSAVLFLVLNHRMLARPAPWSAASP